MIRVKFDLNLPPMEEDGVVGEGDNKGKEAHVCDAPAQKRIKVEDGVCFHPKTPPIKECSSAAYLFDSKKMLVGESSCTPNDALPIKECSSAGYLFDSKKMLVGESSRTPNDALPIKECSSAGYLFDSKKMLLGESSRTPNDALPTEEPNDAIKLLLDYIKNYPEFEDITELKLIIQKKLTKCDVEKHQDRLSIPSGMLITTEFLTKDEHNLLESEFPNLPNGKRASRTEVRVKVIGPSLELKDMSLSRWNYKGNNGYRYALKGRWFDFKNQNKLNVDDYIQIVSFRSKNHPYLAILKMEASIPCPVPVRILKPDVSVSVKASTPPLLPGWGIRRKRTLRVPI